jgi:uncharacterized protein
MVFARRLSALGALLLLGACVTINVYFPAAAAERAADEFIEDVWGKNPAATEKTKVPGPQSSRDRVHVAGGRWLLDFILPAAHAQQVDIEISSPAIDRIKARMQERRGAMFGLFDSGTLGLGSDGLVVVHDPGSVALKDRNRVNRLVADENRDRNALYGEVARGNGHPEWEQQIRATFARRWVANARSGWWYQGSGGWTRK